MTVLSERLRVLRLSELQGSGFFTEHKATGNVVIHPGTFAPDGQLKLMAYCGDHRMYLQVRPDSPNSLVCPAQECTSSITLPT